MGLVGSLSCHSASSALNCLLRREDDSRIKASTLEGCIESQGGFQSESYIKGIAA